jgi:hypothetical protein
MPRHATMRLPTLALAFFLASATPCAQQFEHILDFHSDLTLQDDNSLTVTETITVYCAGQQIRHGIFRDFPTTYKDPFNERYVVGFEMLSATRDGKPETFRVQDQFNGKRIYVGNPNAMAPIGRHVYTITYTTNRQLGFYGDHDELFWNVTGNGWDFLIDHASATVHLPANIPAEKVTLSGFTGPQGSREAQLTTATNEDAFQFSAARALSSHEGLSVLLMWPKGYVAEPTTPQKLEFFFHDNREALLLVSGFLVTLLYYLIAWSSVGRDPARGVIMALYEPPANLSPAAARYLMQMGYDNKTFTAAILDMAVRGYLTVAEQGSTYTLTRRPGATEQLLTQDERQIAWAFFQFSDQIVLKQDNHATIHAAIVAIKRWLKSAEEKIYFVRNSRYLIPAIVLSIFVAVAYVLSLGPQQTAGGIFISFWLTLWTIGVSAMFLNVIAAWRDVARHGAASIIGVGKAVFLTLFALPFLGGEVLGLFLLAKLTSLSFGVFLIATGLLHGVFVHLMKAPTFAGRRLMDQVEGFKLFLGAVDGDRLNRAIPPQQTPQTFEKFLPYALALDVEQAWAEKFSGVLAQAGTSPGSSGTGYTPSFYSGSSWSSFTGAGFASSLGNSLNSAISSASTAPGSSGGGGSGGSGGGGGGGGGGGW